MTSFRSNQTAHWTHIYISKMVLPRLVLLLVVSLGSLDCTFLWPDVSSLRCPVPNDLGCICTNHSDGETHVSCSEAGLNKIPDGLVNPTVLELRNNAIETLHLVVYPSLRQLRLTHNQIHTISDRAFVRLEHLITLSLAYNSIRLLTPNTFTGLRNLELLSLDNNLIHEIKSDVFVGLENLQFLKLSRCHIHTIEPGSFAGLHSLFQLNISHNRINELPVLGDRTALPNLSDLDVSDNRLRLLFGNSLKHLTSLNHLFLSRNRISHVSFPPPVRATLRSLWLRQNHMHSVESGTLTQLQSLTTLDLSHNFLHELELSELPRGLEKFLVNGNPWNCSCGKISWLQKTTFVREWNSGVKCAWPESLRGVNVFSSQLTSECDSVELDGSPLVPRTIESRAFWVGVGVLMASTVCSVLVIIALCRRKRPKRMKIWTGGLRRSEESMQQLIVRSHKEAL